MNYFRANDLDLSSLENLPIWAEINIPLGQFSPQQLETVFGNKNVIRRAILYNRPLSIYFKLNIKTEIQLFLKADDFLDFKGSLIKKYNVKTIQEAVQVIKEIKTELL